MWTFGLFYWTNLSIFRWVKNHLIDCNRSENFSETPAAIWKGLVNVECCPGSFRIELKHKHATKVSVKKIISNNILSITAGESWPEEFLECCGHLISCWKGYVHKWAWLVLIVHVSWRSCYANYWVMNYWTGVWMWGMAHTTYVPTYADTHMQILYFLKQYLLVLLICVFEFMWILKDGCYLGSPTFMLK